MTERYYKFLAQGALGPFSEVAWPTPSNEAPGAWVESNAAVEECRGGVHVCTLVDLSHWLHDELWVVEIDGERLAGRDAVIAERGRLVQRLDAWQHGAAARFAEAARDHAAQLVAAETGPERERLLGFIANASAHLPRGSTALAAYCSAMAIAWQHGGDHFDLAGYRSERVWQSEQIARELGLDG
jgi:hypothetical protein